MEICSSSSRKKKIPPPRNKHHHQTKHKTRGVGPLESDLSLTYRRFIASCKTQRRLLRMASFSKERDRNVFPCPIYCVKWGLQNLVITAPARIGFTAFNRVCSIGHRVIYDNNTARVITMGSNQTKSNQRGPTPFLCGYDSAEWEPAFLRQARENPLFPHPSLPLPPREASK